MSKELRGPTTAVESNANSRTTPSAAFGVIAQAVFGAIANFAGKPIKPGM